VTANEEKRLAEIRARWEAAENVGIRAVLAHADEDVPFLLETVASLQSELNASIDDGVIVSKACDDFQNMAHESVRRAEAAEAKLAASEAAAGQLRAALEKIDKGLDDAGEDPYIYGEVTARDEACQALATDAGKDWVSPAAVKAELDGCWALIKEQRDQGEQLREDAERLRKENENLRGQLRIAADLTGIISEEECARRCQEVADQWEKSFKATLAGVSRVNPDFFDTGPFKNPLRQMELLSIIDRVMKGGK